MYKLTDKGIKECERFIAECNLKRKEILDAGKDTAEDTDIPTIDVIESDLNAFGVDEEGDYYNAWGVTDHYNSDYTLGLHLGTDFIDTEETVNKWEGNWMFYHFRPHIGHKIACVCYGKDGEEPTDISIECEDCNEVLISATDFVESIE